ncbi:MAG: hypothetical protein QOE71_3709 [Pseudonocardiales bacterium]|jgi:hypothetical protein|nr:hypothetical protein [Pseudonocardiales bacterium]
MTASEPLVAGYVAQTAIKTAELIAQAIGGVLFSTAVRQAWRLRELPDPSVAPLPELIPADLATS